MTSSADKAEPKVWNSTGGFQSGRPSGESQVADSNTLKTQFYRKWGPLEPSMSQMMRITWSLRKEQGQLLRVMAEMRICETTEREVVAAKNMDHSFARDLLASLDNLEKAISLIPENKSEMDETLKNILVGVDMTGREVMSVLSVTGLEKSILMAKNLTITCIRQCLMCLQMKLSQERSFRSFR